VCWFDVVESNLERKDVVQLSSHRLVMEQLEALINHRVVCLLGITDGFEE
jgi:hypothetical protein